MSDTHTTKLSTGMPLCDVCLLWYSSVAKELPSGLPCLALVPLGLPSSPFFLYLSVFLSFSLYQTLMSVVLWPSHVVQDLTASTQWDPTCARERSYVAVAIMPVLMEADVSVRLVVVTYEEHAIIFDIYIKLKLSARDVMHAGKRHYTMTDILIMYTIKWIIKKWRVI